MWTLTSPQIRRNMGFWNDATQSAILDTKVSIAGTGGAGYLFALELARLGVQNFEIADPESFEDVNANRVLGARADTLGANKAKVLESDILEINPEATIVTYTDGVTIDNVDAFLYKADLVLNATELSMPHLGTMICRKARNRMVGGKRRPVVVLDVEYIAHGGQVTAFDPDSTMTFERFMGIEGGEHAPLDEVAEQILEASRYLVYLPRYGDLRTLSAIRDGAPLPSNMLGAGVATQLGVAEFLKHTRHRIGERGVRPIFAPRVRWYDAYANHGGITRFPRATHYRHLARVVGRNALRLHEPAGYSRDSRARRGDLD